MKIEFVKILNAASRFRGRLQTTVLEHIFTLNLFMNKIVVVGF